MNTKLLIDGIVRRTTVLIAQLSTAAGVRAPLAHVANQVFLDLARELESQGVGRRVVADMFGLALRGYQRKVQRLEGSETVRGRSLWEAALDAIRAEDGIARKALFERLAKDDPESLGSVLRDLVANGLVFTSGQGAASIYRATTEAELRRVVDAESADSLAAMAWAVVFHHPGIDTNELSRLLGTDREAVRRAVVALSNEGRLSAADADELCGLEAKTLIVPLGAEVGWEGAVWDHFHAVANAIASKVQLGQQRSDLADRVGGTTLHFEIHDAHPHATEVYGLLRTFRDRANALWNDVCSYNAAHPIPEDEKVGVCFYFGQDVLPKERDDAPPPAAPSA